jgi:FkbM family methyltransferase
MKFLKNLIKKFTAIPVLILLNLIWIYEKTVDFVFPRLRGISRQILVELIDSEKREIAYKNAKFLLYTPNRMCAYRHFTFSTKEPEMLDWIDEYGGSGAFYDIGANIGLYSVYYAKVHQGEVFCFEPSVFNLRQLVKNLSINKLSDRATIITNPLTENTGVALFSNGSSEEGGALNTFGVSYGYDGKQLASNISYSIIGFSLDELINQGLIKVPPSIIKIDVDGIEHLVLKGATETLKLKTLKSIYIEVNDAFEEQSSQVKTILEKSGFILKRKLQSELIGRNRDFSSVYNQIWERAN